ncbi:hypothetical protein CTA21_16235 [Salmonella enterica]|nr:hypothetical protein [Salmonella enterica]EDZ0839918.1 hypothetical protein [Salmonella enterica subsp. enterica serovar Saintpaul]EEC1302916.1 hypothetical protein [Salmonella enterica]
MTKIIYLTQLALGFFAWLYSRVGSRHLEWVFLVLHLFRAGTPQGVLLAIVSQRPGTAASS